MDADRMPGDSEAAGAAAAMAETYGWTPRPGERVSCPLVFGGGTQEGRVVCRDGQGWLVDTDEGRLLFFGDEIQPL